MKEKYFVYIIKSLKSGKIYTGYSANLENRIGQHNDKLNNGYTHGRGPWVLIWYAVFSSKGLAKDFENYLKKGSGIAFARKRFIANEISPPKPRT